MKLQYCSDLHLEFPEEYPIIPIGDVLILAGDIVPFRIMDQHMDFFKFCSVNFKSTYWIPGDHEYYGFDITQKCGVFHEKIRSNVHLLNNTTIETEDINLMFSTMWSKINPAYQWQIEKGMNDFHVIKYGPHRFSINRFNDLHDESLEYIKHALINNKDKKVSL